MALRNRELHARNDDAKPVLNCQPGWIICVRIISSACFDINILDWQECSIVYCIISDC